MGIFSKLFSKSSDIEKQLEEQYELTLQEIGMPQSQAKSTVRYMLDEAKKESQQENTTNLPSNFGDFLLKNEPINEKLKLCRQKEERRVLKMRTLDGGGICMILREECCLNLMI